jgi:CheY-like chemotaxis protein
MNSSGLLLCDDLIFSSRIGGEAKAQGFDLRCVKTVQELQVFARQTPPRCVIIDLHTPGLAIGDMMRELSTLTPKPTVVGYGSHVDTVTLKQAREAGCDVVWPRSKFVEELAASLSGWFREGETGA